MYAFRECLTPLRNVCRPRLETDQALGYYRALCDLPGVQILAAAEVLAKSLENTWWPTPGKIRTVAEELVRLPADKMTHSEAFRLALMAAARMVEGVANKVWGGKMYEKDDWNQLVLDQLPPTVGYALRVFGWRHIADNVQCRAQWRDCYEQIVAKGKREKLMAPQILALAGGAVREIGVEPEERTP